MEMLKSSIDDRSFVELILHFSGNELRQRNHKKIRSARKGNDRCDCHKHAHLFEDNPERLPRQEFTRGRGPAACTAAAK
jgi:hypothetical protein